MYDSVNFLKVYFHELITAIKIMQIFNTTECVLVLTYNLSMLFLSPLFHSLLLSLHVNCIF